MPEVPATALALSVLFAAIAALAAWLMRGWRCVTEKQAINAACEDRLEAQQTENDRLQKQTASLMQQVSQYQASKQDAKTRARELANSLREVTEARDRLQRQLKGIRVDLERAVAERHKLDSEVASRNLRQQAAAAELEERDQRIARLKRDLADWHGRLPPLVERFRERDQEARQLETELETARARIAELEANPSSDDTRIEPDTLPGGLDASNDQYEETSRHQPASWEQRPPAPGADGGPPTYPGVAEHHPPRRDDLKRIKGVGPAIEKILNELGFYRFEQIATLEQRDIERIGERLQGFGSRVERDDWVGQARLLDFDGNGR